MTTLASDRVKTPQATLSSRELLTEPATVLLGISDAAGDELKKVGIETVFDLASSELFRDARELVDAAEGAATGLGRFGLVPGELVDQNARDKKLTDLQLEPLETLRSIGPAAGSALSSALGTTNIRELGLWPAYDSARAVLADAYGLTVEAGTDPEEPEDLVPGAGRYPTERVQYDILVLDTVEAPQKQKKTAASAKALSHGAAPGAKIDGAAAAARQLESAGQLDLATLALDSVGFARPAVGALLTYTQSWFAEGLSLGQLLHTVALAPGESTRIAMIDWSRRTAASTREGISESESLTSELTRARSISEITSAVATEAQQGFSQSFGGGTATSGGSASGGAGSFDLSSLVGLPLKLAGGSGESLGFGLGFGGAESSSWTTGQRNLSANMAQNVMDRTQQASNSARNRWATIVREVSQSESEQISTRTVTNYNHMHALSIEYFEIVQLYRVAVELAKVTGCLFVPMKLIDFTRAGVVARYKQAIAAAGLTGQVRDLFAAELDTLVLSSPLRKGAWEISGLNAMFGEPVGDPAAGSLALPLNFFPQALSFESEAPISSWVLEFANGETVEIPVVTTSPPFGKHAGMLVDAYGQTIAKAAPFWNIVSIRAKKQKGSEEWAGDVALWFRLASLQRDGFPKPQNALTSSILKVTVTIEKNDPAPTVFEFQQTMSGRALRQHLMDNQMYYSQAIWRSLDSATITQLLSGFTYEGTPILSQVDPLPVTVAGNFLVFRRHLANSQAAADAWSTWLKARDILVGERTEQLVPLPSGGVFAEAVLGRFNSAEKLDITRFWNWQDSPIPITPPEIAAIQAGSRAMAEDLLPSQLSQPTLQIQSAPDEPAPEGLGAILQAIQNGNMFRDMSGLNSTIGFAQTALTRAFDAAKDAAAQAGENMKTAADIYKSAFGGTGSGTPAKTQGTPAGGTSQPTSRNASEVGALINQGRAMDDRGTQPGSQNGGTSASSNGGGQGGTGARGPNENAAFEAALGNGTSNSTQFQLATAVDKNIDMPMGIDVSHFQGNIDWERVAGAGNVYFAFIKASDGKSIDAKFQVNWQRAQDVGLTCGAYHFWRPLISGKTQAETLIRQLGFHRRGELPPVLDVEEDNAADFAGQKVSDLEDNIQEFMDTIKAEFGILPMIYTRPDFWKQRLNDSSKFSDSMLWVANWNPKNEPALPGGWPTWEFWQLTDSGRVDGINTAVDMSIFNGDVKALWQTAGRSPTSIPA